MPPKSLRIAQVRLAPVLAVLAAAAAAFTQGGCASIAVAVAPEKKAEVDDTPEFHAAESAFWGALHGGDYSRIGDTLELYQRAYLKNPNAPMTAARIGWLHTWRIAERSRNPAAPATITDDIVLARKYFGEASHLAPNESRFKGFFASVTMAEGAIHKDEATIRRGYFMMNDAVDAWPEFNYFTAGISVANLPASDPLFDEGLERQWKNLDVCVDGSMDRGGSFAKFMPLETREGKNRACWDSWAAPHNLSGFFLHMGDMLVKKGDVAKAKIVYANAKLPKSYDAWKYKDVLDDRIAHAAEYVEPFRRAEGKPGEKAPFWRSDFACTGCHAQ
ncbi:MAG: hypothetical protein IPK71_00880 [Myxococcales bacterium]|nr:hypothetical protein [Myxococcales bacterium]